MIIWTKEEKVLLLVICFQSLLNWNPIPIPNQIKLFQNASKAKNKKNDIQPKLFPNLSNIFFTLYLTFLN